MDEDKRKHLEFIQSVINRMASNSFLLKGWCVTLVSAILALETKNDKITFLGFLPIVMFWVLDAYFLRQERLFREKWKEVLAQTESSNFSMDTSTVANKVNAWWRIMASKTLFIFYGSMSVFVSILFSISRNK